jgi:hypothetical protein
VLYKEFFLPGAMKHKEQTELNNVSLAAWQSRAQTAWPFKLKPCNTDMVMFGKLRNGLQVKSWSGLNQQAPFQVAGLQQHHSYHQFSQ